ncbi:uncharacterized protein LOC111441975 [Cucurbita moschata]|uniref:Uncharacterized protein LOC111441975 n=1 Tax=Cucurbita moschata TaxID=3662 RepID=A0A6J1F4D6_CUCMO|nr:uncharacterized protein LOC111441975 [Cucurbita moschata]
MSFQSRNDLQEWSARVVERGTVMDFDLNCPPPDECIDPTGPHQEATQYYNHYQGQAMDNPEFVDEDIAIISPRKFAEARKNFRRNHFESSCGVAIRRNGAFSDLTSLAPFTIWPPLTDRNNVSIQEQTIHNLDLCLSCESSSKATKATIDTDIPSALAQTSSSLPPAAASGLRCAICIEALVEETTTKCGHVFCKSCIETAIATQHRCPICRRKLRKRDIIRIYLPF